MYYSAMMTVKKDDAFAGGLGYWVGSLASAFRKGITDELGPFDVSPVQWAVLEACYKGEATTIRIRPDAARLLGMWSRGNPEGKGRTWPRFLNPGSRL